MEKHLTNQDGIINIMNQGNSLRRVDPYLDERKKYNTKYLNFKELS